MKICLVHNEYGKFSGEEAVVAQQRDLLVANGHSVAAFIRSSAGLEKTLADKAQAFFSGIYSRSSRTAFKSFTKETLPDLIHVHNLFPLISTSILQEPRPGRLPVVMTLHNFRLVCPNALLFSHGEICRQCLGGSEWRCVFRNCEGSLPKSLGYALRTAVSRKCRWFLDNVDVFICLTEFQRQIYISQGFPAERCVVMPNFIDTKKFTAETQRAQSHDSAHLRGERFVLYVGRISAEKDVPTLLAAARLLPDVPFRIAGSYWRMTELPKQAPPNVQFLGEVPPSALHDLYNHAAMAILATRWYEGFPMVILDAMSHSRPIVCTNIGGLAEIVGDHVTGRLYEPGNAIDLASTISELWQNPSLCTALGEAGRRKVESQYSPDKAYEKLMAAYEMAMRRSVERRR